jgi:NAD(P)-dependent dehydrogenase (short-subunit alcohol dehydrogenase family)
MLINNAGMQGPNHKPANDAETIEELQIIPLSNTEDWELTFMINSSAVVYMSAAISQATGYG